MPLNPESIIGLAALLITSPPTVYWLYKLATRSRAKRVTYLPLHRNEDRDKPRHRNPTFHLQRHETWSYYTNIIIEPIGARGRSMTDDEDLTASRRI